MVLLLICFRGSIFYFFNACLQISPVFFYFLFPIFQHLNTDRLPHHRYFTTQANFNHRQSLQLVFHIRHCQDTLSTPRDNLLTFIERIIQLLLNPLAFQVQRRCLITQFSNMVSCQNNQSIWFSDNITYFFPHNSISLF